MSHAPNLPPPQRAPGRRQRGDDFLRQRLVSLDAYRGAIMVSLAFAGFGLAATARNHLQYGVSPEKTDIWRTVQYQFEHVEWTGCAYWDLIQPSFMFMVGVSMAFSYAKRRERGHSYPRMFGHALWRALVLILLGIFLISNGASTTSWSLMNVLTQIGLGYPFLFLLWQRPVWLQSVAAVVLLAGTWCAYFFYPDAGIPIPEGRPEVGVTAEWAQENLRDVRDPWHKNANIGHAADVELLNELPRDEPFVYNAGGYQTLNFIPSLVTMLFGLMCGEYLRRSARPTFRQFLVLVAWGGAGLVAGLLLHYPDVCPLVKRIWTPSWALFSTGWCLLILATLYLVIDVIGFRFWAFPLVVVGVNSIAIYSMSMLLKSWTARTLQTHLGEDVFEGTMRFGEHTVHWIPPESAATFALWEPTVRAVSVGMVFFLICLWMYRQRFFVRI